MKKILTIAILTILTSSAAFANDDKPTTKETKDESSKVVISKESMKLIKKERKKLSKMFKEKNLMC
ncbi:hypothetical protein [Emticicia soli]|uniref:Uncharacterized protein n=1 Tax=Emticicia soli TaxID=2027878 RepID=A0ABW5JAA0_9BACT